MGRGPHSWDAAGSSLTLPWLSVSMAMALRHPFSSATSNDAKFGLILGSQGGNECRQLSLTMHVEEPGQPLLKLWSWEVELMQGFWRGEKRHFIPSSHKWPPWPPSTPGMLPPRARSSPKSLLHNHQSDFIIFFNEL